MRTQLTHQCEQHACPHDCPDVLVVYKPIFDEFGMPIRDGGSSSMNIRYCPWCGTMLPKPKRDLWFDTLANLGINDPLEQEVPSDFKSDAWWRSMG